jgi:xylulose-5-phosphate/fructose-6-phosphate phosphoketolase
MVVRNRTSRYHLVMDVLNNMKVTRRGSGDLMGFCEAQLARHESYIVEHLEDMPEVQDWKLGGPV